jgi:hypothetical protein
MDPDADPGWRPAVGDALKGMIPVWGPLTQKRRGTGDGLLGLRVIFLSFVVALAAIGVVVTILEANDALGNTTPEGPVAVVVAALGAASLVAGPALRRPLPCGSAVELAAGYRTRFFVQVAIAESVALAGFVGFILTGAGWLYPLGAAFSAVGFARLAPTAGRLRADQEELRLRGCSEPLVPALRLPFRPEPG